MIVEWISIAQYSRANSHQMGKTPHNVRNNQIMLIILRLYGVGFVKLNK